MYAEIIVDVNNHNVNQSFYYIIPKEFENEDIVGYRVEVPFGTRIVQGYVTNIFETYTGNADLSKFKYIKKLKDNFPVFTKEMLLLSKIMAEELFCTRIQVLETMIPTIFKNKYIEYYELLDGNKTLLLDYKKYFNAEELIEKKKFEKIFTVEQIGYLISLKAIRLISKIKERNNKTTERYLVLNDFKNKKLTTKQKILIDYLLVHNKIKISDVKQKLNIGTSVIKKLIDSSTLTVIEEDEELHINSSIMANTNNLSIYQKDVYDKISRNFSGKKFNEYLLHGVTGSGKTEIYIRLVENILMQNKEAIVLVPEIILTPQIEKKFRGIFGDNIAVLHSRLSTREKYYEWKKIRDGKVKIC